MNVRRRLVRAIVTAGAALGLVVAASPAVAHPPHAALDWVACPDAVGWQCATFVAPKDYGNPGAGFVKIAVTRLPAQDQAHRIGAMFINYGGPGGTAVDTTQAIGADLFGAVNDRFDLVAFDPRGVGQSTPAIDCKANQETQGIYSEPFTTPDNLDVAALIAKDRAYVQRCVSLNRGILPYVSTANVARDMDGIRAAMGDRKLNYFGFSYGTFLGATYASLFPNNYRSMVLDGPVDANAYINNPSGELREQSAGFEREFGRFFQACAVYQSFCQFGGDDPWAAFDKLVSDANATPIPAGGADPRAVNGDDIIAAATIAMYSKFSWPDLAVALSQGQQGDGTVLRELADEFFGRNPDGTYDPASDRYFTIGAVEQTYTPNLQTYIDAGDNSWGMFDHAWWNTGYVELNYGLWPIHAHDSFHGPFRASASAPKVLVVATTYDPATPFRGAKRLVKTLGNAELLTMIGDGHTAFGGNSPCIDSAVVSEIETLALPPVGTVCQQDVPFVPPPAPAAAPATAGTAIAAGTARADALLRLRLGTFR
jgi:pimeloyl-ACP methyl ester carboxylesterase